MGISISGLNELKENQYLKKFSDSEIISQYDPFWNQLLSYSFKTVGTRLAVLQLGEITQSYSKSLFANNQRTGNFTSLVKLFVSRSTELLSSVECEDNIFVWQTLNALQIIRHLCMFLVENMTEDKIIEQFEACSLDERKKELATTSAFANTFESCLIKDFISALMKITISVPVLSSTYDLHLETINCLIVLLSVQMYAATPSHHGPVYSVFFNSFDASFVNQFVHSLFQHFVEQRLPPRSNNDDYGGSFVLGFASTLVAGLRSVWKFQSEESYQESSSIKSVSFPQQCCLLALVLINHKPNTSKTLSQPLINIFHDSICSFRHIQGRQKGVENQSSEKPPSFHINMSRLFTTLCNTQSFESSTLMLYFLLHNNVDFKAYVLSKSDIDTLIVPILKILYIAPSQNSHHIYMALIIILILTEDDHFNKSIHEINLFSVAWYTDRILTDVSLGDLMILVILRIIQFNMYQLRDRYLHTNCLAALANMSSQFRSIHSYPAQKLFELIASLTKRHKLYKQKLSAVHPLTNVEELKQSSITAIDPEYNYAEDIQVLEEVIRMLLEIVNSCFSTGIHRHNSNLVYALLQKREAIEQLKKYQVFQDILQNIESIINFFIERIDRVQQNSLTINEVQKVIEEAVLQLPSHYLRKFPDLKFRYLEEESPDDFFVPYVWSLVFNKSGIYWNPGCVQLFSLEQ